MKFYIDIGHGGNDPGAVSGSFIEYQMNAITANAMADRLKEYGHTVKVEQGHLSLADSAQAANAWGADFLLSDHKNAGGGDRGEVIYSWKTGSLQLAEAVALGLKRAGQTSVKAYKSKANSSGTAEYFGILRMSNMPGVIIEHFFLDNVVDRKIGDTPNELKQLGISIADAIATCYGGALKEVVELDNTPDTYAKEAVEWAVKEGLLMGNSDGNYMLRANVTRQNLLVFLYRFYLLIKQLVKQAA